MADLPPLLAEHLHSEIDAKGRMALPAKFRSQLGSGMVMAKRPGTMRLPAAAIGIQTDRGADQRTSMGTRRTRLPVCSFPAPVDQEPDKQDASCACRCSAITRIWTATLW